MPTLLWFLLAACSTSATLTDVRSDAGLYAADLTLDPDPPQVGENHLGLDLRDPMGMDVPDCGITVEAMMPEHGHGGAVEPLVTAAEGGHYEVIWPCIMAGRWELTFDLGCPGGDDLLAVDVDVD